jgi:hypothetical protein
VYGGGLYAGGIFGENRVAKNQYKNLVVFTVELADPQKTDYTRILKKNFLPKAVQPLKVFHLRGGIDYKNWGYSSRHDGYDEKSGLKESQFVYASPPVGDSASGTLCAMLAKIFEKYYVNILTK